MLKMPKELIFSIVSIITLVGCGNGSSSSSSDSWYGKFVDTGIVNLDWSCGNSSGKTGAGGVFGPCLSGNSVTFSFGSVELGTVAETSDYIITPQDLLGANRDASQNSEEVNDKVNAIVALFLTVDSEANKGNDIVIKEDDIPKIVELITENGGEITADNIESITDAIAEAIPSLDAVTITEAAAHIATTIAAIEDGTITSPNQNVLTGGTTVEGP